MPSKDPEKRREAVRRWYQKNKAKQIASVRERSKRIRESVYEYKRSKPCMDCNVQYPHYVMEFDHVRGEKIANVADMINRNTTLRVWEEIEKCDLVCANCHRLRTHARRKSKDGPNGEEEDDDC
jgi:hypothetical protein